MASAALSPIDPAHIGRSHPQRASALNQLCRLSRQSSIAAPIRKLELRTVSYKYPDCPGYAVSDVTLSIPAGSTVAILGENGAGKSTLAKLLLGLYRPAAGELLIARNDGAVQHLSLLEAAGSAAFQDY